MMKAAGILMLRKRLHLFAMTVFLVTAHADSTYGPPWVLRVSPPDGFSIDPKMIMPAPGTRLTRGNLVTFRVEVTYRLTGAKQGLILMLPIVDNTRDLSPRGQQLKKLVDGPGGRVALEQSLIVPSDAMVLSLVVPLTADDDQFSKTRGEIIVLYPVVKP